MARAAVRDALPRDLDTFVRWHGRQTERWEFAGGAPMMIARASRARAMLGGNVFAALRAALEGSDCAVYGAGIEVRSSSMSCLPDVVVSRQPPDLSTPVEREPVVVVEIVSPSTALRERVLKWEAYRRVAALHHYLVVEQDHRLVELHTRQSGLVFETCCAETGSVPLDAIGVTLDLATIYRGVVDG